MKKITPFILYCFFLIFTGFSGLHAQDTDQLLQYFRDFSIPVKSIDVKNQSVEATLDYSTGSTGNIGRVRDNFLEVFKKLAQEYPLSTRLRQRILYNNEVVLNMEVATSNVVDFAHNRINADEFLQHINRKPRLRVEAVIEPFVPLKPKEHLEAYIRKNIKELVRQVKEGPAAESTDRLEKIYQEAYDLTQAGKLEEAIAKYEESLKLKKSALIIMRINKLKDKLEKKKQNQKK
jgi:hypothetical protein